MYELDAALDRQDAGAFLVWVEYSESACGVYRRRAVDWLQHNGSAAGDGRQQAWRKEHGPEYAYYRSTLDCQDAGCSVASDRVMITAVIEGKEGKGGKGWERLNHRMALFRRPLKTASVD